MTNKSVTESLDVGTREAVNDFFDALSKWRDEVASSTERYSETVLDKMVAAATAMGWPKEVVEASRVHLVQASKMQTHMIDQLMNAWQAQVKFPTPNQFIAQLQPYSGIGLGIIRDCASSALDGSGTDLAAQLGICLFDVDRCGKSRSTKHAYCTTALTPARCVSSTIDRSGTADPIIHERVAGVHQTRRGQKKPATHVDTLRSMLINQWMSV